MGATNEIKGTNISLKLPDLTCPHCSQKFTEQEIDNRNFDIWFDTSNDVNLEPLEKGYQLTIWIRSIEHEFCPPQEECSNCAEKKLEKQMKYMSYHFDQELGKYLGDEYFCDDNCEKQWLAKEKEKSHE